MNVIITTIIQLGR